MYMTVYMRLYSVHEIKAMICRVHLSFARVKLTGDPVHSNSVCRSTGQKGKVQLKVLLSCQIYTRCYIYIHVWHYAATATLYSMNL